MVKRFNVETSKTNEKQNFITESPKSKLLFCSVEAQTEVSYQFTLQGKKMEGNVILEDFIEVKGWKALGNKLSDRKLSKVKAVIKETIEDENQQELFT